MNGRGVEETLHSPGPMSPTASEQSASRYRYHLSILVVSALILTGAAFLNIPETGGVEAPFFGTLPGICTWKRFFGLDCPGCGLTRCFVALSHGHFGLAWSFNPAGFLLFALLLYQLPFRLVQIWRIHTGRSDYRHSNWLLTVTAWIIIATLLVQWFWR